MSTSQKGYKPTEIEKKEIDKLFKRLNETINKSTDNYMVAVSSLITLLAIHLIPVIKASEFKDDQIDDLIKNVLNDMKSIIKATMKAQKEARSEFLA